MKKYIIMLTAVLCFASSSAEWKDMRDYQNLSADKSVIFYESINHEFVIPFTKSSTGIHIAAFDSIDWLSLINLRHKDNIVDCSFTVFHACNDASCNYIIYLLDDNKFLIKSIKLDLVAKCFTGELYHKFEMKLDDFKKIKYYKVNCLL